MAPGTPDHVRVKLRRTGEVIIEAARWCSSFGCKFLGYQFRRKLDPGEALILVHDKDTQRGSSIHMLFVFTELAAIWINDQGRVTSVQLARPWRLHYSSPEPARYVLEGDPGLLDLIAEGDEIDFV